MVFVRELVARSSHGSIRRRGYNIFVKAGPSEHCINPASTERNGEGGTVPNHTETFNETREYMLIILQLCGGKSLSPKSKGFRTKPSSWWSASLRSRSSQGYDHRAEQCTQRVSFELDRDQTSEAFLVVHVPAASRAVFCFTSLLEPHPSHASYHIPYHKTKWAAGDRKILLLLIRGEKCVCISADIAFPMCLSAFHV